MAVKHDGLALQFVIRQTIEICQIAIEQNEHAKKYARCQI